MEQGRQQSFGSEGESKASTAIETLKSEAAELAKKASNQMIEQRVDRIFSYFDDVERAVRAAARELENGQHTRLAQYVNRAAEEVVHARDRIRGAEPGQLLSTAENLVRSRPGAVMAAAFAAGFAFVRLLKDAVPSDRRNGEREYGEYGGDYDMQTSYSRGTTYGGESEYGSERYLGSERYGGFGNEQSGERRKDDPAEGRNDV